MQHSVEKRASYSLWNQLANITTDRQSLPKDDRLEAMAGAVRYHKAVLVQDEEKAAAARSQKEAQAFIDNPMGYLGETVQRIGRGARGLIQQRRNRKR